MNLFSLALRNQIRKVFRTGTLVLAVAIASAAVFATGTVTIGVDRSVQQSFSQFGADMMVVPDGTMVTMERSLLTGEPSVFYMNETLLDDVRNLRGVAQAAPQLFLTTEDAEHCVVGDAFLVGFDPQNDFTVTPWLGDTMSRDRRPGEVIVGYNSGFEIGETVLFYGERFTVWGQLQHTGMGLSDHAVFMDMEDAYALAESAEDLDDVALGYKRGDISAILLRLDSSAQPDQVHFAIARNPEVNTVTAGNIVTNVRQTLVTLFAGTAILTGVLILGNILMISAIFSTIINERRKEFGLLRAVGARKGTVFRLVMMESAMVTLAGGILGILLGGILLRIFDRSIGYYLARLDIPFFWPEPQVIAVLAAGVAFLALAVGTLGALYPAVASSRIDPYDAIRSGE